MITVYLIGWLFLNQSLVITPVQESYDEMAQCQALGNHVGKDFAWVECYNPYTNKSVRVK